MVDPISSIQNRAAYAPELIESRRTKEAEKSNSGKSSVSAKNSVTTALTASLERREVTLELSVGANPSELRLTGQVLMEKVSAALQQRFGLKAEDLPSAPEDLPEEASAGEIMDYFSPEKTAQRIVDFATKFFDIYLKNHEGEESKQQVEQFTQLIGQAIDEGFKQAEQSLGGSFDDLGEIGDSIKRTYDLVMEGLEKFREDKLVLLGEPVDDEATPRILESPSDEMNQEAHEQLDMTA